MTLLDFPLRLDPEPGAGIADDGWQEPEAEAVPAAGAPEAAAPGPLVAIKGDRMEWHDDMRAAIRHALAVARHQSQVMRERDGGIVHGLLRAQPPSIQQQCDYANGRAWVPPGHDGGLSEGMGVVFHAIIGRPGVAIGGLIGGISGRPLRWCIAAGLTLAVTVALLAVTGHDLAAWIAGLAAAMVTGLWAAAGWLLMRVTNPGHRGEQ